MLKTRKSVLQTTLNITEYTINHTDSNIKDVSNYFLICLNLIMVTIVSRKIVRWNFIRGREYTFI